MDPISDAPGSAPPSVSPDSPGAGVAAPIASTFRAIPPAARWWIGGATAIYVVVSAYVLIPGVQAVALIPVFAVFLAQAVPQEHSLSGGTITSWSLAVAVVALLWSPSSVVLIWLGIAAGQFVIQRAPMWRSIWRATAFSATGLAAAFAGRAVAQLAPDSAWRVVLQAATVVLVFHGVFTLVSSVFRTLVYGVRYLDDIRRSADFGATWPATVLEVPLAAAALWATGRAPGILSASILTLAAVVFAFPARWLDRALLETAYARRAQSAAGGPMADPGRALSPILRPIALTTIVGALAVLYGLALAWVLPGRLTVLIFAPAIAMVLVQVIPLQPHLRGGTVSSFGLFVEVVALEWPLSAAALLGLPIFVGQALIQRRDIWRAITNACVYGLAAVAVALAAQWLSAMPVSPLVRVALQAATAVIGLHGLGVVVFAATRSARNGTPYIMELLGTSERATWPITLTEWPLLVGAAWLIARSPDPATVTLVMLGAAAWTLLDRWLSSRLLRASSWREGTVAASAEGLPSPLADARLQALTAGVSEGLALLTPDGVIKFISPRGALLLDRSPSALLEQSWLSLHHPEDHDAALRVLTQVVRTPGASLEASVRLQAGSHGYRPMRCQLTNRLRDPAVQGLVLTFRDLTQELIAETTIVQQAEQMMKLSQHLVETEERERAALARALHDEAGQIITAAQHALDRAEANPAASSAGVVAQLRGMLTMLHARIRNLSITTYPAELDEHGLLHAILMLQRIYTESHGITIDLRHEGVADRRFPPLVEATAYRIVQEALTNVARHAGVMGVRVLLWADQDAVSLQIEDHGRGFDVALALASDRSAGLHGMQERTMLVGGELDITASPGQGSHVSARLPFHPSTSSPQGAED